MSFSLIACENSDETQVSKEIVLTDNWKVQQADKIEADGKILSSAEASTDNWYTSKVPSTIMGVLTANGLYKDILEGTNYKKADRIPFDSSWWYRTSFNLSDLDGKHVSLQFDGITYRANIWLNGEQIASKEDVYGPFCRFSFDITDLARENNVLAVEVFRAREGEPNIGFVDWNPRPLDENMGIFRSVSVNITGDVQMKNTWVQSSVNTETLKEASLNIETELNNLSDNTIDGQLRGEIESINFSIPVKLAP
ncbi:MAG TPA: glycoside hydrolase family 2, partial [Dysgonomonas sp.]|nr:glycoside hydrolase family 2 [Dysgonomonas sp.]